MGKTDMAPRTVRHVYGTLYTMFADAVAEELIETNPCVLERGELPKKRDKDPTWRAGAVFTRDEVERIISGDWIPDDRRVLDALLFLGGLRVATDAGGYHFHRNHRRPRARRWWCARITPSAAGASGACVESAA